MKTSEKTIVAMYGVILAIAVFGFGGWVANIVKIINTGFDVFTGLLIVRCIGVVLAPLGAVLGYI